MVSSALYPGADIKGHVALVTGASSGIGEACALRLAEAGVHLVLVARREDRLVALQRRLRTYGVEVHVVAMDVADVDDVARLPHVLPSRFAAVDILVNNAGLALGTAGADSIDMKDARTMMDVNVLGLMAFCRAFLPGMKARGRGHVVNLGSIAGHEAYVGGSIYCASKHAVDAFTTSARHDLVGTPIRVTAVSPGAVQTEFSVVRFRGDKAAADAVYKGFRPLSGADVADNVMYALTRPTHVQVCDMVVLASQQSSAKGIHRSKL
mmetsp:Transcript_1571/g.2473  ORF Transcript_1571/g.2473 Transcript_1571/m.2473 type:complete len:266 (+) Transcript_1571:149-946(+)